MNTHLNIDNALDTLLWLCMGIKKSPFGLSFVKLVN
jgi:hypothetical protein